MQSASKSITATISSERPIPFPVFSQLHNRTQPITQLDKDPKAAIARIETGARRVSLVRDLTDLAHAALERSR
jgi:hypothetical protein